MTWTEKQLGQTLTRLFPQGSTTTEDMAQKLIAEGIHSLGLTHVAILSQKQGPQDKIIFHIATGFISSDGKYEEDHWKDHEIAHCLRISPQSLRFLDLSLLGDAGLVPGKIGPLDIFKIQATAFKSVVCLISQRTENLARNNVDIVIPNETHSLRVLSGQNLITQIHRNLSGTSWRVIQAYGNPHYGSNPYF